MSPLFILAWSDNAMNTITSAQNPVIKEIKALANKKSREEKALYFIEGIRFVEEAIKEKAQVDKILVSERLEHNKGGKEILERVKYSGYSTFLLPEKLFKEISDTESPQGIMAVLRNRQISLDDVLGEINNLLILESLQDPGNMGTIIRTADAAGITGIIASKGCVDIYNPKVLRSTMGSIFRVPVYVSGDLIQTIGIIKSRGIKVYAAHLQGEINYFEADLTKNTAVIIGNEANGLSDAAAGASHVLLKIPMSGRAESLNASVAASILMYEAVRQRMTNKV